MLKLKNLQDVKMGGFEGFSEIGALTSTQCAGVPNVSGVYMVLDLSERQPKFLESSTGGFYKGKDPTVDIETLQANWVPAAIILYIGKTATSLRSRLQDYMKFGNGMAVAHHGGRYIWQLANANRLTVCWRPVIDGSARTEECKLIAAFEDEYGYVPFANLMR